MANKVKPTAFRVGIIKNWSSRWMSAPKDRRHFLEEDALIRRLLEEKIGQAGIASIEIERTVSAGRIFIKAARPGLIIGRGGKGIEDLTKLIHGEVPALRNERKLAKAAPLGVSVIELPRGDVSARVVAQNIAWDLEKRYKFRRTVKKYIDEVMSHREIRGVKIRAAGRLDGAEISRSEKFSAGNLPLSSLRADIDYGEATARTTYGAIGLKVWIYKGDIFENRAREVLNSRSGERGR